MCPRWLSWQNTRRRPPYQRQMLTRLGAMSMPMAIESPDGESLNPEQAAFAQRLRDARERQRLSIETIAASMNIQVSLLDALEHGDIRRWPAGIFRRAFFRGYVSALGFDSEPLLRDFLQLFPESPPRSGERRVGKES